MFTWCKNRHIGNLLFLNLMREWSNWKKTCLKRLLVRAIMQKNRLSHISIEQSEHTADVSWTLSSACAIWCERWKAWPRGSGIPWPSDSFVESDTSGPRDGGLIQCCPGLKQKAGGNEFLPPGFCFECTSWLSYLKKIMQDFNVTISLLFKNRWIFKPTKYTG